LRYWLQWPFGRSQLELKSEVPKPKVLKAEALAAVLGEAAAEVHSQVLSPLVSPQCLIRPVLLPSRI